jgi:hypothetical protein
MKNAVASALPLALDANGLRMAFHPPVLRLNLLAILAAAFVLAPAFARADPVVHGAILPSGAHQVGKDRYQSPSAYAETLKFYSKVYSVEHYPRRAVADLPGVRAIHLVNGGHGDWDGLNIYEFNGVTRIFVLSRTGKR